MPEKIFSKKIIISAAIFLGGLLIASGIFILANFNFVKLSVASGSPEWTQNVGAGIAVPACGSSSPSLTCQNQTPAASVSWTYTDIPNYQCNNADLYIDGNKYAGQPCSGSYAENLRFFPSGAGGSGGAGGTPGGVGGNGSAPDVSTVTGKDLGPLVASLKTRYGAGGGAGQATHSINWCGTFGANGGGYIIIEANNIIIDSGGSITARGAKAADENQSVACFDGAGGGGGGGTVVLRYGSISNNGTLDVSGGMGGLRSPVAYWANGQIYGATGGNGGGGAILQQQGNFPFGSGALGNVTISSDVSNSGTLEYNNLTIAPGGILRPSQKTILHIKVTGTLKVQGAINGDGRGGLGGATFGQGGEYGNAGGGGGGGGGHPGGYDDTLGAGGGGGGYGGGNGKKDANFLAIPGAGGHSNYYYSIFAKTVPTCTFNPDTTLWTCSGASYCTSNTDSFGFTTWSCSNTTAVPTSCNTATDQCIFYTQPTYIPDSHLISDGSFTPLACLAPAPVILTASCSVSPTSAIPNQLVTWTAAASGGDGSYVYSWSGTDGLSGSTQSVQKSYSSSGTKTGSVTVTSGGQILTQACSNSVNILSLPGDFTLSAGGGLACNSVPLSWTASSGADAYRILRGNPRVDISPYQPYTALNFADTSVSQNTTYQYQIEAYNSAGTNRSNSINVTTPYCPPTLSFSGAPTSIYQGQSVTLTWSTANVTSCTASGAWSGSKAVNGSEVVIPSPPPSVTYTLTCTGPGGSTGPQSVIVNISPLALPNWKEIIPR